MKYIHLFPKQNTLFLAVVALLFSIFIGCTEQTIVDPNFEDPTNSIGLDIQATSAAGVSYQNGIITVLPKIRVQLYATWKDSTKQIGNITWQFSDNNSQYSGNPAEHIFDVTPPAQVLVTVSGYDQFNVRHSFSETIQVAGSLNSLDLWVVSSTATSGGKFQVKMAGRKSSYMKSIPAPYGMVGDPSGSYQSLVSLAPADTNLNNNLQPVSSGMGDYFTFTFETAPDDQYELGIAKFRNGNSGDQVWNSFSGPYVSVENKTLIKLKVLNDGRVVPYSTPIVPEMMPGVIGDSLVRTDKSGNILKIYTRTGGSSAPFVRFQDSSGVLLPAVASQLVPDYPAWTVRELNIGNQPMAYTVAMHFGENISYPTVYSLKEKQSRYYLQDEQILKFQVVFMSGQARNGNSILAMKQM